MRLLIVYCVAVVLGVAIELAEKPGGEHLF